LHRCHPPVNRGTISLKSADDAILKKPHADMRCRRDKEGNAKEVIEEVMKVVSGHK